MGLNHLVVDELFSNHNIATIEQWRTIRGNHRSLGQSL